MATTWHIDQVVCVEPRTWAGINRPGGVGKIVKIHREDDFVQSVDVKYTVGGGIDQQLDLDFVKPYVELERQGRSRRTRDFFQPSPANKLRAHRAEGERKNNNDDNADDDQQQTEAQQTTKKKSASEKCTSRTTQRAVATEAETQSDEATGEVPTTVSFAAEDCSVSPLPQTPNEIRRLQLATKAQQQSKPQTAKRSLAMTSSGQQKTKKTTTTASNKPRKKKTKAPPKKPMNSEEMSRLLKGGSTAAKKPDHQPKWKQATLTSLMQPATSKKPPPPTSSLSAQQQQQQDDDKQSTTAQAKQTGQKTQAIAEAIMGKKAAEGLSVRPRASVETAVNDRVPLKQVYRNQMERASDFVNDIVGKPADDEPIAETTAAAAAAAVVVMAPEMETEAPPATTCEPPIDSSRLTLFTDILGNILMRRPELCIGDVLEQVNGDTKMGNQTPYTNEERDVCLEHLNDKDTVMISDGMIFSLL